MPEVAMWINACVTERHIGGGLLVLLDFRITDEGPRI